MKRAAARAAADEASKRETDRTEANKGDVQRALKEARRQDLEDARTMAFARGADDEDYNAEMRGRVVWGDPMAGALGGAGAEDGKKRGVREGEKEKDKEKRSVTGRPLYKGSARPNRYSILPGWKWDGVERGNDFESRWFKARNAKGDRKALEWNWQMDE